MLNENIKTFRKAKGLSQDELAIQLNVVRQTVSKWENGLSVPDSEMLVKLANTLETTVNALLSESVEPDIHSDLQVLANKLEVINAQLLNQRETRRKVWRTIFIILSVISVCVLLVGLAGFLRFQSAMSTIGGVDGPTAIFVTRSAYNPFSLIIAMLAMIISIIGIYKTQRASEC